MKIHNKGYSYVILGVTAYLNTGGEESWDIVSDITLRTLLLSN